MSRSVGVVLVMLLVAAAIAACGEASDDDGGGERTVAVARAQTTAPQTTAPPADVSDLALARRALVRLEDMPDGWTEDRGTVTRLNCGTLQPFRGASALVKSNRLTHAHSGVQERVAIYPTAAGARQALRRLDSRTAAGCLRREVRNRVSQEAGGPASPARLVRVERLGPNATARRYISESVSQYGKAIGYIDAVHVRTGRALAALVFVSGPEPPEAELYERVVQLAPRRLQTTLS